MTDIRESILNKLKETENIYKVKIPLAIESGSRGWGFASIDSDYDCRFIYVHLKDRYLSVFDKKDVIEYASDAIFDINGWDIKKVLLHITKSNAVMHEWLSSNEIYIKDKYIAGLLQDLASDYFNPIAASYHYLSIAKNTFNEIITTDEAKLKKYFYILRPIANLNFIYQYGKIPYMEYDKTLNEIDVGLEIIALINELKQIKAVSNESHKIKTNKTLIQYFQKEIDLFTEKLKEMKFNKNRNYEKVDKVFREIIDKVWSNEC